MKTIILYFQQSFLSLFVDENGYIEPREFSTGKHTELYSVSFDFEREDLVLALGVSPHEVNHECPMGSRIFFAGYQFSCSNAFEAIVRDLIEGGYIPDLDEKDKIYCLYEQFFYQSVEELKVLNEESVYTPDTIGTFVKKYKKHTIRYFDFDNVLLQTLTFFGRLCDCSILFANRYIYALGGFVNKEEAQIMRCPCFDAECIKEVLSKHTIHCDLPPYIANKIKDSIIEDTLYEKNRIVSTIYQNRKVSLANNNEVKELGKAFLLENTKKMEERFKEVKEEHGDIVVFDSGLSKTLMDGLKKEFGSKIIKTFDSDLLLRCILRTLGFIELCNTDIRIKAILTKRVYCREAKVFEKDADNIYPDFTFFWPQFKEYYKISMPREFVELQNSVKSK